MGGSSSSVSQTYNTTVVNKSTLNSLNSNVNKFIANTTVSQAKECSANISQIQTIDFSNTKVAKNFNFAGANQSQSAALTFDCVQLSKVENQIANGVMSEYMTALESAYSTNAQAQMNATAGTSTNNQFGGFGGGSDSSVNVNYQFTNITDTNRNIQNIMENVIDNNLKMEDIQSCISSTKQNQSILMTNMDIGGDVTIGVLNQDQAASVFSECVQSSNNAATMTNQIANAIGLKISDENAFTSNTTMESTATAETKNGGLFQGIGEGIASVVSSVGDMLTGLLGVMLFPLISLCGVVCLCICICIAMKFMMGGGSSPPPEQDGKDGDDGDDGDEEQQGGNSYPAPYGLGYFAKGFNMANR